MNGFIARPLLSAAIVIGTAAGLGLLATPAAAAAEPDPVMNKAVFNNPIGTVAEQNAIFAQLARVIDRVPAGEEIQMSFFDFSVYDVPDSLDTPDLVDRLVNAYTRGVRVKIIVDQETIADAPYGRLRPILGSNDAAGSYIVHCADKFPSQRRGCIGTRAITYSTGTVYAYNHNKFLTATKIVLNNGTAVSNVVYQASANLTWWDANEAYNNGVTFSDSATFQAYRKYFADLRAYRYDSDGNNNYYWVMPTGTTYKGHFFPRQERSGQPVSDPATDTVISILNSVTSCSYYDAGWHQTDVRVAMWSFTRTEVAKKLTALRNAGCWVDVVYSDASSSVLSALGSSVQVTKCNFNVGPGRDIRLHSKYILIDGAYDDDIIPRVFTGSHNLAISALRQADETLLRIMGRGMHDDYLRNFWKARDTCRANGGIIH